jgi:hypothetical protein
VTSPLFPVLQVASLGLSAAMGLAGFALFRAMDTPTRVKYAKGLRRFMLSSVHHDTEGRLLEIAVRALVILMVTHPVPEDDLVRRCSAGQERLGRKGVEDEHHLLVITTLLPVI